MEANEEGSKTGEDGEGGREKRECNAMVKSYLFALRVSLFVIVVVLWSGCKTRDGPIRSQSKDTIKYYNRNKCGVIPISGFLGIFC